MGCHVIPIDIVYIESSEYWVFADLSNYDISYIYFINSIWKAPFDNTTSKIKLSINMDSTWRKATAKYSRTAKYQKKLNLLYQFTTHDVTMKGDWKLTWTFSTVDEIRFDEIDTLVQLHTNTIHYGDVIMSAMASQITSRSKKTSRLWLLCVEFTCEFPTKRVSNAEYVPLDDVIISHFITYYTNRIRI